MEVMLWLCCFADADYPEWVFDSVPSVFGMSPSGAHNIMQQLRRKMFFNSRSILLIEYVSQALRR